MWEVRLYHRATGASHTFRDVPMGFHHRGGDGFRWGPLTDLVYKVDGEFTADAMSATFNGHLIYDEPIACVTARSGKITVDASMAFITGDRTTGNILAALESFNTATREQVQQSITALHRIEQELTYGQIVA